MTRGNRLILSLDDRLTHFEREYTDTRRDIPRMGETIIDVPRVASVYISYHVLPIPIGHFYDRQELARGQARSANNVTLKL